MGRKRGRKRERKGREPWVPRRRGAARRDCVCISSRQTVEEHITRVLVIFNPRRDTCAYPGPLPSSSSLPPSAPPRPPASAGPFPRVLKVTYLPPSQIFRLGGPRRAHQTIMVKNIADTSPVISVRPADTPNLRHNLSTCLPFPPPSCSPPPPPPPPPIASKHRDHREQR